MKILVTGGSGFVGGSIVAGLERAGHSVVSLRRRKEGKGEHCDLLDQLRSQEVLARYRDLDCVVHAAALAHGQKPPDGHSVEDVNLVMTENLVAGLSEFRGTFVFLSSIAVYGAKVGMCEVSVNTIPDPSSEYGRGKVKCEQLLKGAGFRAFHCFRLPPVYDEAHMKDVSKRVYFPGQSYFKMRLLPPPAYSFLSVSVLVEEIVELMNSPQEGSWLRLVCDREPKSQSELVKMFAGREVPVPIWLTRPLKLSSFFAPAKLKRKADEAYSKLFADTVLCPGSKRFDHEINTDIRGEQEERSA